MDTMKYKNIKRYAAFLFMLFTVYAGSQEQVDAPRALKSLRSAAVYTHKLHGMLAQSIMSMKAENSSEHAHFNFNRMNDAVGEDYDAAAVVFGPAVIYAAGILLITRNNWMTRNNIWRRMVF